jgi:S1-C subfamily serine protease
VKITGVMGSSWAQRAGLLSQDIVLSFNRKKIDGLKQFQTLVQQAAPEKDYQIKVLRGDRVKSFMVTVGEGEMEGVAAACEAMTLSDRYA